MLSSNKPLFIFSTLFLALAIAGCTNSEIGDSKDVAQDKIYQQYYMEYTEGDDDVSVISQFRFAGENGTTLVLNAPSQLELDGQKLEVDSTRYGGAIYRTDKPAAGFFGKHRFVFTNIAKREFVNEINFDSFKILPLTAQVAADQDLRLYFETKGFKDKDLIELSSTGTDSSFFITHHASDGANFITIPAKQLQRQKQKEFFVKAKLYHFAPLLQATSQGGEIKIVHTLRPVKIKVN